MPRDYKSRAQSHSRRKQKKSLPGYVWLLSGLAIGLFIALIVYLDKQPENEQNFGSAVQHELEKLKQKAGNENKPLEKKQSKSKNSSEEKPEKKEQKFNFYTLLPELEVLIPESETRPPEVKNRTKTGSTGKSTEKNKRYVLQVGSFQSLDDAEKLKANLAFLGVAANIQNVRVNNQSWHRVRTGPYQNKQQLYQNQKLLKKNHITAISMELK